MPDQFQSFSPLPISWPSLPVFVKVGRRNTRVATTRAQETRSLEACQTPLSPSTNRLRLYSQSFPLRIEPDRVRSCTRLRETWRNLVGLGGKGGGGRGWRGRRGRTPRKLHTRLRSAEEWRPPPANPPFRPWCRPQTGSNKPATTDQVQLATGLPPLGTSPRAKPVNCPSCPPACFLSAPPPP